MARMMLTRRSLFSAAALAGLGALAGCSHAAAPETGRAPGTVFDRAHAEADASGAEPPEGGERLTLLAVGDVLLHPSVQESGLGEDGTRDYAHLFAHVADDVEAADLALVSQETILGGEALGLSGYPSFNGPQEVGDAEVGAGFDVVLHANNHALDRGLDGIAAELAYWRSAHPGMLVTGIADSREAAGERPVIERAGHTVAVLNYATYMNGVPLPEPWCVRMMDAELVASDVAAVRAAGADLIVACPHWGDEYAAEPNADQRGWAQTLADAGADVIIGGHPHVLQPFEVLASADGRTVPVFWSVGNFVSGQSRMDTMVGGMAQVSASFSDAGARVDECRLTALVTQRAKGEGFATRRLADYTEELAAANGIRAFEGCEGFSCAWCVEFCSERLGEDFDPVAGELVWRA